jgi:hypothetical protein
LSTVDILFIIIDILFIIIDILFFTVSVLFFTVSVLFTIPAGGGVRTQPSKKNSDALLSMSPTVLSRGSRTSDYQPRFGIAKLPSPIVSARGGPVPLLCKTAAAATCSVGVLDVVFRRQQMRCRRRVHLHMQIASTKVTLSDNQKCDGNSGVTTEDFAASI